MKQYFFYLELLNRLEQQSPKSNISLPPQTVREILRKLFTQDNPQSKFWRGGNEPVRFTLDVLSNSSVQIHKEIGVPSEFIELPLERAIVEMLTGMQIFDFNPQSMVNSTESAVKLESSGHSICIS